MRAIRASVLVALCVSCRQPTRSVAAAPAAPQVSGAIETDALSAPVRVVRDRWGVPHIYAASQDDLFVAQGFVQAQDRLFQMDLWRRSVQGRLSEVLGSNFIERDIMTRRIQYDHPGRDWDVLGADTRAIAVAFVRGINACVRRARERPPEEFLLAGWHPEEWAPEDLLNRTDAFLASRAGIDEVLRARLVAFAGARGADIWLPDRSGPTHVPAGLDVPAVSYVLGAALRRVGTAPFFMSVHASTATPPGSNAWAVEPRRSTTGSALLANDPHGPLTNPSRRYIVHLHAPGWNVIGAATPWLPGIAIGHNDRVAWGMAAADLDVQDLFVERVNPLNAHQVQEAPSTRFARSGAGPSTRFARSGPGPSTRFAPSGQGPSTRFAPSGQGGLPRRSTGGAKAGWVDTMRSPDAIRVKGRDKPFAFERERTARGPIVAVDRERHLAFAVRWTGDEPGAASELAAPDIDRARSWSEFKAALTRWRMPPAEFVYADKDGILARQAAGLIPIRSGWNGTMPAPAWTGVNRWASWRSIGDMPHEFRPAGGYVLTTNDDQVRTARLRELVAGNRRVGVDDFREWQRDTRSWIADRLVPRLERTRSDRSDVEDARRQLLVWDRRLTAQSSAAALYVLWERAAIRQLAAQALEPALADDYLSEISDPTVLLDRLMRDEALLGRALTVAVEEWQRQRTRTWGMLHTVLFKHPLAVTDAIRRRFDVGPFTMGGYRNTLMATYGHELDVEAGPSFRQIVDVGDWDRSVATNAPGQSGSPASPHFRDLAEPWSRGEYFPLLFTDEAVRANAEATLTLVPKAR